jgi:hypothetical protein
MPQDSDALIEQAKARFRLALNAEDAQRKRELSVLKFDAGDQWPDDVKRFRGADVVNGVPIPARPMLTIPKTDAPVKLVVNQQKRAHLGVQVHPVSDDADDETAETLQGLYRHIEQQSRAHIARGWAFTHAVKMGRGFWRVLTKYAEDGGVEYGDQDICVERILNQESAYMDPYAEQPDWSDAQWGFIGSFLPVDRYKKDYPDSRLAKFDADDPEWETFGDSAPGWSMDTEEGKAIRVMEYFVVETTNYTRIAVPGLTGTIVGWKGEAPEGHPDQTVIAEDEIPEGATPTEWDIPVRAVKWYKLNGIEVLDEQDWPGQYIPIIVALGEEKNVGGVRKFTGMIEPAMDAARLFNMAASSLIEKVALTSKAPWQVAEGQDEGYEDEYAQANTRNLPVLHYKPTALGDRLVPPPIRNFGSADVSPEMAMLESSDRFIKSVTAVHDPSLGEGSKARSGKAELALQGQADASNSNYLDDFAQVAMTQEARIVLDLIPKIYDRPGRITRILRPNDEQEKVMLNAPFSVDPQTKRPMPAQGAPTPGGPGMPAVKRYDLAKGRYGVVVSIGKSWQTRAQQGADEVGQALQAVPALMPMIGDIYFRFRDFPGAKEIADRLKKMLPPQLQDKGDDGAPTVEALTQQLQQGQQAFQQLQQQAQQMKQALDQELTKRQAEVAIAQGKEQSQAEIQRMKVDGELEKERIRAQAELEKERIRSQGDVAIEQIKAGQQHARAAFDREIANESQAASAMEAERGRMHDVEMGERSAMRDAEREARDDMGGGV